MKINAAVRLRATNEGAKLRAQIEQLSIDELSKPTPFLINGKKPVLVSVYRVGLRGEQNAYRLSFLQYGTVLTGDTPHWFTEEMILDAQDRVLGDPHHWPSPVTDQQVADFYKKFKLPVPTT